MNWKVATLLSDLGDARLVFVTGKGGVGKSTVAALLARALAAGGRRVLLHDAEARGDASAMLGLQALPGHRAAQVGQNLAAASFDPAAALDEFLRNRLGVPALLRIGPLARAFDDLAVGIPGVRDLLAAGKPVADAARYDTVVVDAAATGHLIGVLTTFDVVRELFVAPAVRGHVAEIAAFLTDPAKTRAVVVTRPEATPRTEAAEVTVALQAAGIRTLPTVVNAAVDAPTSTSGVVLPFVFGARDGAAVVTGLAAGDVPPPTRAPSTPPPPRARSRHDFLERRVLVVAGAGGVGKTTVAAAFGFAIAAHGRRALVLTVDPARRLGQTLGGVDLGHVPCAVPGHPGCDAALLDPGATLRHLVRAALAPDAAAQLENARLFPYLADRLVGSLDALAFERYLQVAEHYDTVVVDTAPSRRAIDVVTGSARARRLLAGGAIRLLAATRGGPAQFAVRPVARAIDAVLGASLVADVFELARALQPLAAVYAARSAVVDERLRTATESAVVLVTTPEWTALRNLDAVAAAFATERVPVAGVIANRVWTDREDDPAWTAEVAAQRERLAGADLLAVLPYLPDAASEEAVARLAVLLADR